MDEMNEDEPSSGVLRGRRSDGFRNRRGDRSIMASNSLPSGWGVGPWDDLDGTWTSRAYSSGDLRAWIPGMPVTGSQVQPDPHSRHTLKGPHHRYAGETPDEEGMVKAACWCGEDEVRIPVEWVRQAITSHCKRRDCTSQLIEPDVA